MTNPRVEELPDDFDDSIDLDKLPAHGPEAPASIPNVSLEDLYEKRLDGQNALSNKSFEEVMFDMSKTPLFMNEKDLANQSKLAWIYLHSSQILADRGLTV